VKSLPGQSLRGLVGDSFFSIRVEISLNGYQGLTNFSFYFFGSPRTIANKVLSPSFWYVKNPSNRIAGNKETDDFFTQLLREKVSK
jgi:hypothetical protein